MRTSGRNRENRGKRRTRRKSSGTSSNNYYKTNCYRPWSPNSALKISTTSLIQTVLSKIICLFPV